MDTSESPWRARIVGLEYHPASALRAHGQNWRGHGPVQKRAMAQILDTVGIADALICYKSNGGNELTILDGHMRAGMDTDAVWPCLVLDVTDEEAAFILATHDPIAAMASVQADSIAALLESLGPQGDAVQAMLDALGGDASSVSTAKRARHEPDHTYALSAAWARYPVRVGDRWHAGRHTLVCADACVPTSYAHVGTCALALVDPPYGVGETYTTGADTPERVRARADAFLPVLSTYSSTILLTPGTSHMWLYPPPDWTLCWCVPQGAGIGPWGFCCWHPVLAYGKDPYLAAGLGSRPDAVVMNAMAPKDTGHPCPKPLSLWTWLMERGSIQPGDAVLDPFLGSGTTLLVAEQLDRICYGIELSPEYCAVALCRWADLTGKEPRKMEELSL